MIKEREVWVGAYGPGKGQRRRPPRAPYGKRQQYAGELLFQWAERSVQQCAWIGFQRNMNLKKMHRERERESKKVSKREREREKERVWMWVWVWWREQTVSDNTPKHEPNCAADRIGPAKGNCSLHSPCALKGGRDRSAIGGGPATCSH